MRTMGSNDDFSGLLMSVYSVLLNSACQNYTSSLQVGTDLFHGRRATVSIIWDVAGPG